MRVDLRGTTRAGTWTASRYALLWSGALAVLLVVSAAISGATRFTGPRWLVSVHTPPASRSHALPPRLPPGRPQSHGGGIPSWILWVLGAIIAAILLGRALWLLWRWWSERTSRAGSGSRPGVAAASATIQTVPEPEPDAPVVRTGIELALQVLREQREPADAVVRAWLGLQETAEQSGVVRGAAETPTEFTSRIVRRLVTDDRAVRTLLRLYLRARFGDHPVTADDVETVRTALQEMVATWAGHGSPTGARPR